MATLSKVQEMMIERLGGKKDVKKVAKTVESWDQDHADVTIKETMESLRKRYPDPFGAKS